MFTLSRSLTVMILNVAKPLIFRKASVVRPSSATSKKARTKASALRLVMPARAANASVSCCRSILLFMLSEWRYFLIFSFSTVLGLKPTVSLGGISWRCLVAGLTMTRSVFFFVSKLPKPCTLMVSPSSKASAMISISFSTSCWQSFEEVSVRFASSAMNSLLVMGFIFILFKFSLKTKLNFLILW